MSRTIYQCPQCGEEWSKPHCPRCADDEAHSALASANGSAIPSAQALIFQPELTHSVWTDVRHRKRSRKSLEAMLRKGVRSGEYVGYRLLTIETEYIGISWPNAPAHRAPDTKL